MMSKAEDRALEKYPVHSVRIVPARGGGYYADSHLREGFIEGYQQAEKDLLEKVVNWLIENTHDYDGYEKPFVIFNIVETQKEMINALKIAMKNE